METPGDDDSGDEDTPERRGLFNFGNTDLAFAGDRLFVGSYHGFNTYRVEVPASPQLVSSVVCPGGQGDVSVVGDLLILSVEQTRGRLDCGPQGVAAPVSAERFRGIRIFDISDLRMPRQLAAVQTCRGSHTHTVVTDPDDEGNVYVYGSGTAPVRSGDELTGCSDELPSEDPDTALFRIDVIRIPLASPADARVVSRPTVFEDPDTGAVAGLWRGGDHGPGTQRTAESSRCHDITAFPEIGLAAGACSGNGILLDISDPVNPVRVDEVVDPGFAYWHSATFNNDGTKVIFTDEWGGGGRPRCRASDPRDWGANAIYDIVRRQDAVPQPLQAGRPADRPRELRGAQRFPRPGAGPRHHGAGVVPGGHLGFRLHRLVEPVRDRVLRPRPDPPRAPGPRRPLVRLLVPAVSSTPAR